MKKLIGEIWKQLKTNEELHYNNIISLQCLQKKLQNQRCKEGKDKKVRLECAFSKIGVKGKWFKNNNEIFPGKRYSIIVQGDMQILEILGPVTGDEAKYKCQCLDEKTEALLEVDPPDPVYKFVKKLAKDSKGFVGHETILECTCNSSKAPVKWFRNNQKLEIGEKYFIESDTSGKKILRIQNCTEDDSGTYSCKIATNEEEVTTTKLQVVEPSYKFMRVLRSIRINETQKINLECEVDYAEAEVFWEKDGVPVKPNKHIDIQVDGKKRRLVIRKSKLEDEGKYIAKTKGDTTEAEVLVEPLNRFKKGLKDIKTFENEKVVFEVELTDNRASLIWLQNGKEIKSSNDVQFKFHDDKHMLILNSCKLEDAGEITCMINENIKSTCKFTVLEREHKPSIKFDETDVIGHADKPFTVEIPYSVAGTRVSEVQAKLLRNGQPAKDVEVQVKPDKVVLYFKKPVREQSDKYQFELSNDSGKEIKELNVNILDVPKPPEGPLEISNIFKDRCHLKWKPSPDTGGIPLLPEGYIIEIQDPKSKGGWSQIAATPNCEFDVTGLTPNKQCNFRIRAVNKKGSSAPLNAPKSILAKDPWDPPSKVENVEITDWDADRVDLKWDPISNSGGIPLVGYVVEFKDKFSSEWKKGVEVGPNETSAKQTGLKEGQTYEFRVRGKNEHLLGEPSDPTKPILCKPRFVKPFILGEGLKNLIVKKGAVIKFDIKFKGEPPPNVCWMKNGQEIYASSRLQIDSTETTTLFNIKSAVRGDSGKYKLLLTNSSGQCESTADIVVLDKPTPPEGPLILEEVRANHVKIKWKKPKDNGGQELKGYLIEKFSEDTGRWIPVAQVDAETTDFKIEGLTKNKKYNFRVRAVNAQGESDPLENDGLVEAKNPYDEPSKPGKPIIEDYDNKSVDLKWDPPASDGGRPILFYKVQCKYNKGGSPDWTEIAKTDGPICSAKIQNLKENAEVEFRVIAINKAGDSEPSDSTGNHIVKHRNLAPKIDRTNLKNLTVKVGRNIKLEAKVIGEPPPEVTYYFKDQRIENDQFIKITNVPYYTTFEINNVKRKHNGKYTIKAVNRNGQDEVTVDLTVLGKPEKPTGPLDISDIHAEGCSIKWAKPKDDGGCPIDHYEIEKYDVETGRWTRCGKSKGTDFEVSGLTPGKKYKFKVVAVNSEGDSEPIESGEILAKNPFDEPSEPKDVIIDDYDNKSVKLKWTKPDNDNGAPITGYILEMRRKDSPDWIEGAKTIGPDCEGTIEGLYEGEQLEFRVKAVNAAGPGTPSKPTDMHLVKYKNLKPKIDRAGLKNLTLQVGKTHKFEVKVAGEPAPELKWIFLGKDDQEKELKSDDHHKINNKDYFTEFSLTDAVRKQSGKYKLFASNINGTDEEIITINVIGKPSKPKGPLKISKVQAESCKLSWEAPEDDGGLILKGYKVEKMDLKSGKWTRVGKTTEPEFDVSNLIEGHQYLFRVTALNDEGESEPLEADHPIVAKNPYEVSSAPTDLVIADYDNKSCDLKWKEPDFDGNADITSYTIEMKSKLGDWVEVCQTDGPKTEVKVENLIEGDQVRFRVKANNRAGSSKPSEPTATHLVKYKNLKPYIDRTHLVNSTMKVGKTIKLTADVKGEPAPTTSYTFSPAKGGSVKELGSDLNITLVNKEYYTEIEIKDAQRIHSGMYTVKAVNKNGEDSVTFEICVLGKPSKPSDISVSDVHKTGCKLTYGKPIDDGGCPIDHYEIEKLDVETGRWTKCGSSDTNEFNVKNLIPGKEYKFRVSAVNKEGVSEPLETTHSIIAKDPFSVPDKCTTPVIDDYDNKSAKLSWAKPKENGAPITGYIVEMQVQGEKDWKPVAEVDGSMPEANVKGLVEGQKVKFRVKAVNKAGPGEASDPTDLHTVRFKHLAPKIDRTNIKDITVKVGRNVKLEAKVAGEEPPRVEYTLNGKILGNDKHITINNPDYFTELTIEGVQRKHAGPITIKATNSSGEDEVTFNLNVIGKPSKPEGPLKVSDVTAEGCHLKWSEPIDDGGLPIDHYQIERLDPETGRWVPCGKSKGTEFDVTGLTPGHEYKFRCVAVNAEGDSEPLETLGSIIARDPFDAPDRPGKPVLTDYDSDFVELAWKPPIIDGGSPITGYIIEKKEKNGTKWTKAIQTRGPACEARVSDLIENQEYEFRVVALNKAGESQPSIPSDMIKVRKKHHIPKIDLGDIKDIVVNAGDQINLEITVLADPVATVSWYLNDKLQEPDERISINNDEPEKSVFKVKSARRDDTGKIKIKAKNKNGEDEAEISLTVLDKPSAPEGPLEISNPTATGVKLSFKPPLDDGGIPISHYNIEKMNPETGRWVPCGKAFKPEYDVTGLEPGKPYEFRVSAVNALGESEPLKTEKPIQTATPPGAPSKPDIKDVDKNSVELEWTPPKSDPNCPITGYIIEKKEKNGTNG